MAYTPMMEQYLQIKSQYPDAILFFRLGDFYEMFFDDALLASRELSITLTGRDAGAAERVPMCGVPYHAADTYIEKLINKGYKVAICEQVEDPAQAKGIVRREVIRVFTPGTYLTRQKEQQHNYLAAIFFSSTEYGLAIADVTTGLLQATQIDGTEKDGHLLAELTRIMPAEILVPASQVTCQLVDEIKKRLAPALSPLPEEQFRADKAGRHLEQVLGIRWRDSGIGSYPGALSATGALLAYLLETQKNSLGQFRNLQVYTAGQYMILDANTRRNLELVFSLRHRERWGTLLWVLDKTRTAMGGRMLRTWLEQPLLDMDRINQRLDAVSELVEDTFLRQTLQKQLKGIYDLERLATKTLYSTVNARDMLALRQSLLMLPEIVSICQNCRASLLRDIPPVVNALQELGIFLLAALADDPPATLKEGNLIKSGFSAQVDRLRQAARDGRNWLVDLENREKERTGIKSLKISYNKVFGYYIEVTKANLSAVPADYQRKQTLANAERFITPALKELEQQILGAEENLIQLEYNIFNQIREKVAGHIEMIQQAARWLATVDALVSLAEVAFTSGYTRPSLTPETVLYIENGRHPVVEKVLDDGSFVPNDLTLDKQTRLILLTGPNMAGKSTFMRQVALIVLMAQAGSFVPADRAVVGLVDRIFTRIGAADDLAAGESTFMVEMKECEIIVKNASPRSLIIMDEVGRGTSTHDGISIARALLEHIAVNIQARTLFSTHYHELTVLDSLPGVANFTMAVLEEGQQVCFLRKVIPGKADKSYGIHVAALAGLPADIIRRAKEILADMEKQALPSVTQCTAATLQQQDKQQLCPNCESVRRVLQNVDINHITPVQALNILAQLCANK
ncbi:MAG: DNA mismatch repair protein MutS [Bacillota bacterium]|uniref:DNA mismatch repair protein MutS n=1 Tax=Desulfurispora thermophila TaxID=265470 RepID=UPI000378BA30|nr:DNA mismatch repair protein MutS [Desulfurispora thermophila]